MTELADKVNQLVALVQSDNHITPIMKPGSVVGVIRAAAETLFPDDANLRLLVQNAYYELAITSRGMDPNKARQSWVSASGGNYEDDIRAHINGILNNDGIVAIKGDKLQKLSNRSSNIDSLIEFLTLPAKRRCTQTSLDVWPDNDVLVLAKRQDHSWRLLASISAKTSSHSRNTSVLFWAMAIRPLGLKYFLATQDGDDKFVSGCLSPKVTQDRKLFEAYCDRVFTSNTKTSYCSQVRSLLPRPDGSSELTDELLEVRRQEVPDAFRAYTSIDELEQY